MNYIIEESVEEYIRKLLPQQQELLNEIESYATQNHVPIIQKEVAALLKILTKASKSKKILEIGTAIGYSSIILCQSAGEGGFVTTIERDEERVQRARLNIEKANLSHHIRIIEGEAQDVLNFLDAKYDLIFLDGAKGHYKEMLQDCINLLEVGGLLVSDNILFKGMVVNDNLVIKRKRTIVNRMREYLQYICNHPQLDTSIIPIGDGLAISYKTKLNS
ncbi:Predicted O-methyltransferase YrrM [Natronincola peptidivorans]|uniref:tRNA 5-hydroxyuridine methyltransferase n=1 Tax=Natronincola peptidivorans TaxID=426128 RepID=A0A1H9YRR1_9FIRM|nr:O-methyltransferase [Natronincola peptidivorans]SES71788.1 Predicted O-methyltransferase YrrM [Natronincola peptidivorans]